MSYPQQPHAYQPPPPPPAPVKAKRWPWILGIVAAFVIGAVAGTGGANSGNSNAQETVTVRVPAPEGEPEAAAPPPAEPAGPATTMSAGVYQVGIDVAAGQYKTAGPADSLGCYWARLSDDSGNFEAILANGNPEGPTSLTINDGEFIELSGDCTWNKVG